MKKRILLLGGNFYPELTGIGKYNGEMIDWLAGHGHECTVVTTYPYYPYWKVQKPYDHSFWYKKETRMVSDNKVQIYRCPHYVPRTPTGLRRMLSEFSFFMTSFFQIVLLMFQKKCDYIVTVVPSFQLGLLGMMYKKIRGAKFFYHVQDLQIDAAKDLHMIRSSILLKFLFRMEKYILKNADLITSISAGMIRKIEKKGAGNIKYLPNWVDVELFYPVYDKERLKRSFGFSDTDRIVLYSGGIGEKQGLDSIIYAAEALKKYNDVKFVICGSGPYKEKLMEIADERSLTNVVFMPLQAYDKFNDFLNCADLHLILQKSNAGDLVMPSKLTTILAVGGVSIITACESTSLYSIVDDNKMGILIQPDDQKVLNETIEKQIFSDNSEIRRNARYFAENSLSINKIMSGYTSMITPN